MKTRSKLFTLIMVLISVSMLNAQTWEFDSDLGIWEVGSRGANDVTTASNCTSTWVDGAMKIDITAASAQLRTQFNPSMFALTDLNALELRIKNESAATTQNIYFWLLPAGGGAAFTKPVTINLTPNNTGFEDIEVNLHDAIPGYSNGWTVYAIRIDQSVDTGSVTYDYIRFAEGEPVVAVPTGQPWEFDSDLDVWAEGNRGAGDVTTATKCTSTWVDGAMKIDFSETGAQLRAQFNPTQFTLENLNFMELRVKNESAATSQNIFFWILPTEGPAFTRSTTINLTPNNTGFEDVIVDLTSLADFSNDWTIFAIRIDQSVDTGSVTYDYIRFIESEPVVVVPTGQPWEFDSDLDVWTVGNRGAGDVTTAANCTSTWGDGAMKIDITGASAQLHAQFNPVMFPLTNLNFLELSVKNESAANTQNMHFWILPAGGGGAFTRSATISLTPNNTGFENVVFDLTTLTGFSNDWSIYGMRIDQSVDTGSVTYDYIRFIESEPVVAVPTGQPWEFDSDLDVWAEGNRGAGDVTTATNCTSTWADGAMKIDITDASAQLHAQFNPVMFPLTNLNFLELNVKNESAATTQNLFFWILPTGGGGAFTRSATISLTPNNTGFENVVFDLTTLTGFSNDWSIYGMRIDQSVDTGSVTYDYIRFIESEPVVAVPTGQPWEFDSDLDVWAEGNRGAGDVTIATNCTSTWADGAMKIDITDAGAQLHSQFNPVMFPLTNLNFLELNVKNESAATTQNLFFWILPAGGGGAFTRSATISLTPNNTGFENVVFDLTTLTGFSNDWTIYGMRIDQSVDTGSVTYDYIRFVESETSESNEIIWTFDCDQEGWGEREHGQSITATHELTSSSVNSGHIEMTTPAGLTHGWMFGTGDPIDADLYRYLHISLTVEDADELPAEGLSANIIIGDAADQNLSGLPFTVFKGQNNYTIDLSNHSYWHGTKYINRIHFPIKSGAGYNIENAVYLLDWIAISDSSTMSEPTQDTSTACIPETPVLGEIESVIFCNRVSFKTSLTGNIADATLKIWKDSEDPIEHTRKIKAPGTIYLSTYDLDLSTTYNYTIELHNSAGSDLSEVKQFTTEAELAEDQPANYWMTPSPFDLIENASDDLLDNDTWTEAAELAQVYKIHSATYRADTAPEFYSYDFPKLIYTVNKYRMRLALENVASGNESGEEIANGIFTKIEDIAAYGGKLEFLTWDGIFLHSFNLHSTKVNFRTPDEGIEEVAEAVKLVKDQYPDFELIPLPNVPNWDVTDADGNTVPHNAGNNSAPEIANATWNELCDLFLEKMANKGVANPINYIEIDHPFNYYTNGRETSKQRVQAMKDYCTENNLELMVIINTSVSGMGQEETDAKFKESCLQYLDYLREDGIDPQNIDVESWYPYPQYLVPETKENSFTNVIRDLGKKFFFEGIIEIQTAGNVTEIIGFEETLQMNAVETDSGDPSDVNWTVDLPEIATVDVNGLLTSHQWGEVIVTATSKVDDNIYATITITVIDPDEPTTIIVKSEGDVDEIAGIGSTLQFYAENADNGEAAEVDWSVDNIRAASIDANGLLTISRLGTVMVKAILKSNGEVSATFTIKIVNTLGIDNPSELEQIKLYPNPANRFVYLEIPQQIEQVSVKILDVTGKCILANSKMQSGKHTLSTDKLSNGMYFMQITSDKGNVVRKVIINK